MVQGWMYHANLAATVAAVPSRVPVIWSIHHSLHQVGEEKPLTRAVMRCGAYLSRLADRIVYVSQASAQQHEASGYRGDRRIVIPNGFDCRQFRHVNGSRVALRHELGSSERTPLIGMVGRYHPAKDHRTFLEAASLLLEATRNEEPRPEFVLVGSGVDGSNDELASRIDRLGIRDAVHLLGERTDLPQIYSALDVFTSSSSGEAFPLVVGEAMACGVPSVVTDVGDCAAVVGDSGLAVPAQDPKALKLGWEKVLQMNVDQRVQLGDRARSRVLEEYTLDAISERYASLYLELYADPLR